MEEFEEVLARFVKARSEYQRAFVEFNKASMDLEEAFAKIQKELDCPEEETSETKERISTN
ncbi:MAG: hypothetical protein ACHQEM_11690 [Chitinophagales bacterium]